MRLPEGQLESPKEDRLGVSSSPGQPSSVSTRGLAGSKTAVEAQCKRIAGWAAAVDGGRLDISGCPLRVGDSV